MYSVVIVLSTERLMVGLKMTSRLFLFSLLLHVTGYVLMQRIFPKPQTTAFLRKGELLILPSISELGVYGVFLGDGSSKPLLNSCAGYLLRTKPDGVDEGGVAAGFSVLSSVILVDKDVENVVAGGEGEEST
jgi:Eukaryotic glutathione synthase, ATP binding domain